MLTDFEVTRSGGHVTVTFKPLMRLTEAVSRMPGIGIYAIYRRTLQGMLVPVYVGQGDVAKRLRSHIRALQLSDRPLSAYWVQWANIRNPSPERLGLAEHTLIIKINNYLQRKGLKPLRNRRSTRPFRVKQQTQVSVHRGKVAPMRRPARVRPGQRMREISQDKRCGCDSCR